MAIPVWPVAVPYRPTRGWTMPKPFIAPNASEMNGGNQRLRSQPGSNVAVVNYPLGELTRDQFTALDSFFRNDLTNGASRFTMTLWLGTSYQTKTVQFEGGEPPTYALVGSRYLNVVLKLRVYGM